MVESCTETGACAEKLQRTEQRHVNERVSAKLTAHDQEFEKVWRALSRGDAQVRAVAESVRLMNERQARYGNIVIGFTLCLMVKELGLFTVLRSLIL